MQELFTVIRSIIEDQIQNRLKEKYNDVQVNTTTRAHEPRVQIYLAPADENSVRQ